MHQSRVYHCSVVGLIASFVFWIKASAKLQKYFDFHSMSIILVIIGSSRLLNPVLLLFTSF